MKITTSTVVLLALLGSACESESRRSAVYAEKCKEAEQKGFLEGAEQLCESAWVDVDNDRLAPAIQSERLYDLGRIKRQLGKFAEAEPLVRQALAIEESVSGKTSPAYGLRLTELSLILAGQGKWEEGADYLEEVLVIVNQFPEQQRRAAANVLNHFGKRLQNTHQKQLAKRFRAKAAELRTMEGTKTIDNE